MSIDDASAGLTLAFDTSASVLDIVLTDGTTHCRYTADAGRRHNELLVAAIRELFREQNRQLHELSRVVCCRGPGSFTGLRIGMSTAKGIAAARDIPVFAVPTLTAYRWASPETLVLAAIDGRKKRFYAELFDGDRTLFGPADAEPARIVEAIQALTSQELLSGSNGNPIYVVGPDSQAFIRKVAAIDPGLAGLLAEDPVYFSGIAPALVACIDKAGESTDRYFLDSANGPDYLRPSQAEE